MNTLGFKAYTYFGTGGDQENFQTKYTMFQDDVLFAQLMQTPDAMYHDLVDWQDLNIAVGDALTRINAFLNARYIGNDVPFMCINPYSDACDPVVYTDCLGYMNTFKINIQTIKPNHGTRGQTPTKIALINGQEITDATKVSALKYPSSYVNESSLPTAVIGAGITANQYAQYNDTTGILDYNVEVYPTDFIVNKAVNSAYANTQVMLNIIVRCDVDAITGAIEGVKRITIRGWASDGHVSNFYKAFVGLDLTNEIPEEDDYSNPYSSDGVSTTGGGDGTLGKGGLDSIDPAEVPDLPSISAADLGFITMYNPTAAQLKSLSDFMWSNLFDLNTYKKLFSDPMQSVIGLSIVPVSPTIGGSKNVKFGTIDSGISMSYLSTNYVQLDCGSVSIEKYIGCFMDNEPYTKVSIYLPFIGIRQLSSDDIIGGSIHVVYNIDVLTGACACFIEHSTRGVLYSYNGSCITNVPLTAVNFSGAIQNAVSAIGSAVGVMAGMATGAAPITAMSTMGLMTSAANTALNAKPSVQRSGNLGGSAGILSIMTPYVIIERPALSVPNNVQHYAGQTCNITMLLGDCKGLTMCEYVHLDNISATTEEIMEIESLLKVGVIL